MSSVIRIDAIMEGLPDVLLHTVLQFAKENNSPIVAEKLLQETAIYFDMEYFRDQISKGQWDTVERYLLKFTKPKENSSSTKTFYLIKKQKFLEALAENNVEEALHVFEYELKVFKDSYKEEFKDFSSILRRKKPRDCKMVSNIKDIEASRTKLADEAVALITANSKFHGKLELPVMEEGRLLKIIMQGVDWQHTKCKNPREKPEFSSLYVDHSCDQIEDAPAPSSVPARRNGNIPVSSGSLPIVATTAQLETIQESVPNIIPSETPTQRLTMPSAPSRKNMPACEALSEDQTDLLLTRKSPTRGKSKDQIATLEKRKLLASKSKDQITPLENRKSAAKSKDQKVPTLKRKLPTVNQNGKSKRLSKRQRDDEDIETVQDDPNAQQNGSLTDDLPVEVVMSLPCNDPVESMDFHPLHETILLYGTDTGNIFIWELRSKKILAQDSFRIWDVTTSDQLYTPAGLKVQKVTWSPDGNFFAVAYLNGIVHIYSYPGTGDLKEYTEIEAHEGEVSDVAFTTHDDELWVVTCGADKTVEVWDTFTGRSIHTFDCFKAPVCSIYPHRFKNRPAIYATDITGTVTILLYNDKHIKHRIPSPYEVEASKIAFSAVGPRFFIGGTNDEDESCILELSLTDCSKIKHAYSGLVPKAKGYVNYDISNGKHLAAVDDKKIKFWEVDNNELLKTIGVKGELLDVMIEDSAIKFNKNGMLLAVTTKDDYIKILANEAGKKFLQGKGKRASSAAAAKKDNYGNSGITTEVPMGLLEMRTLNEINDCRECISKIIPNNFSGENVQVSCLAYTKLGRAILVLGSKGEHKLWEWPKTATNPSGRATPKSEPKLWQAPENAQMINDVGYANPEGRISCFTLPRNRHYVLSTSGGIVSVYDITTFKTIAKITPPSPVATALAIHPKDSNTFVFGMEDSSIQIFQFKTRQVLTVLAGHIRRVTGLAFSDVLNVLVSSGADSQLCIWSLDEWKKLGNAVLKVPVGRTSDTRVQFHKDQTCLLAVHKLQIAIYTAPSLVCINQWVPEDANSLITHAAYSCDCETIFVVLQNGNVEVLSAMSLDLKCRINPTAYIPPSHPMQQAFPLAVAAHPSEPNQFAVGLTDGSVVVLEPKEETWGNLHSDIIEDEAGPSFMPGVVDLDELVWEEGEDEEDF